MTTTWTKLATNIHWSPKIRRAGRDAKDVFIFILTSNTEQQADGELPGHYVDPSYLADALMMTEEQARNGVKRCETFHLLHVTEGDPGVVSIVGWGDEWKTPKSTDRVKKYREKKKKQAVKDDETFRNVSVTSGNGETPREEKRREEKRRDEAVALATAGVNQLNTLLVSKFSPSSKSTITLCEKLVADKITPEQVQMVVTFKVQEWRNDQKMSKWLKPDTLFANANFHKYLDAATNAASAPAKQPPRRDRLLK